MNIDKSRRKNLSHSWIMNPCGLMNVKHEMLLYIKAYASAILTRKNSYRTQSLVK